MSWYCSVVRSLIQLSHCAVARNCGLDAYRRLDLEALNDHGGSLFSGVLKRIGAPLHGAIGCWRCRRARYRSTNSPVVVLIAMADKDGGPSMIRSGRSPAPSHARSDSSSAAISIQPIPRGLTRWSADAAPG